MIVEAVTSQSVGSSVSGLMRKVRANSVESTVTKHTYGLVGG